MNATFMAKPFSDEAGNGMHVHLSVVDKDGNNVFTVDKNKQPQGLFSQLLEAF